MLCDCDLAPSRLWPGSREQGYFVCCVFVLCLREVGQQPGSVFVYRNLSAGVICLEFGVSVS